MSEKKTDTDAAATEKPKKAKRAAKNKAPEPIPAATPGDADAEAAPAPIEPTADEATPAEVAPPESTDDSTEEGVDGEAPVTEDDAGEDAKAPVDPVELARTVEALLFAAEEAIAPREIARASGSDSATIRKVLKEIKERYDQERRPWDLTEVANGFRLVTRPEFFPAIQRLKTQTAQRKLTQAALETLALIAYKQPLGRAEIESIRGVGAGPVLRMLLEKKLIKIAGRGTGVGQPLHYGTTDYFLEHFGLRTTQELPRPGEFKG